IADFGKRAQEGKLTIEELAGGTFSISNGGIFGSMLSTPIINPPQSAILGVHATRERAVVENGQIVARPMNYLALSYDHRIIVGCIPSKALLESSENYARVLHQFKAHGITASGVKLELKTMLDRKDRIVSRMTSGVAGLFKKNKITWLQGHGRLVSGGTSWKIDVEGEAIEAKHVIIATGSKARHLPGVAVDNKTICDNEGALAFDSVPERLGVIGAGVVGLELGSVWRRLGAKVKVLEALPAFLGAADEAVAQEAWKQFTKNQGLEIELGATISKVVQQK